MLTIHLPELEDIPAFTLELEHSLVSLSKWEQFYEKPFFGFDPKTADETAQYIRFMVVGETPPENFLDRMSRQDFESITEYINAKRTATTFPLEADRRGGPKENITSELMYYWLVNFQIPFHPTETWHLNNLMTLVRVCSIKQEKPKKMSQQQVMERNKALNEQRRREMGTAG